MYSSKQHGQETAVVNPRLRILHVTEAPLGGVATYIKEMLAGQTEASSVAELHVLIPEVNKVTLDTLSSEKLKVHTFKHKRRSPMAVLRLVLALVRLVPRLRPDIIHAHATIAGLVVRVCLPFVSHKSRIVYCPHGWLFNKYGLAWLPRQVIVWAERTLATGADMIVCVSEHERNSAIRVGVPEATCAVVTTGIADFSKWLHDKGETAGPSARLRALYVGRFDRDKGFDVFLDAMKRLGNVAEGYAVGKNITDRPFTGPIPDNVVMCGWRDREDLGYLYERSDLIVVPSRAEAFGLAALEAMRAGLPVFCARVGGLPELVIDGETGHVFDVDDVEQLTSLIRNSTRSGLRSYGLRGRQRYLERFTAEAMNRLMLEHYVRLVEQQSADRSLRPAIHLARALPLVSPE